MTYNPAERLRITYLNYSFKTNHFFLSSATSSFGNFVIIREASTPLYSIFHIKRSTKYVITRRPQFRKLMLAIFCFLRSLCFSLFSKSRMYSLTNVFHYTCMYVHTVLVVKRIMFMYEQISYRKIWIFWENISVRGFATELYSTNVMCIIRWILCQVHCTLSSLHTYNFIDCIIDWKLYRMRVFIFTCCRRWSL